MSASTDLTTIIARVRELDAAATKGPWMAPHARVQAEQVGYVYRAEGMASQVARTMSTTRGMSDAALIAEYRTAAPALADEVERLAALFQQAYGVHHSWVAECEWLRERVREHEKRENALHSKGMQFRQERDALKAKLAEAERERDAEVNAHDKLDDLAVAYARERDEARAERDAKQAGYEALGEMLSATCEPAHDYAQEYECGHAGENVVAVVVRDARALRSRLAKVERVVEAARLFRKADSGGSFNDRVECGQVLDAALRALDNSGGSGAATSTGTGSASEACSTPEPAGSSQDSPVGVAATLDPQAPATRAELEELRRRVERLEATTQGEKE